MARSSASRLRSRLHQFGLSTEAINAAWPRWWSDEAEGSTSARTELVFSVARKFGLDARSLLDEAEEPRFLWRAEARFKHLSTETDLVQAGITSFGRGLASILVAASPPANESILGIAARDLRKSVLTTANGFVGLTDLLALCWAVAIPIAHLRVFPWPQKRMAAMTAHLGTRWAVLLAKDSRYPAPIAFYLAHEIGHISLGHLDVDRLIVDLEDDRREMSHEDSEEVAADRFALELLTGEPQPVVLPLNAVRAPARELARVAQASAQALQIEPGVLAQCYGYSTGDWQTATAALRYIYSEPRPVWAEVNQIALRELQFEEVPPDAADFLRTVLGDTGH